MDEDDGGDDDDDELPCVDHDPLNEGAVGKMIFLYKGFYLNSTLYMYSPFTSD